MSKEELETTKDVLHSILQGVSCTIRLLYQFIYGHDTMTPIYQFYVSEFSFLFVGRLESPIHLIRKMASSIALVFSKAVDPKNPLYLDDDCCETVDWEFGIIPQPRKQVGARHVTATCDDDSESLSCKKENGVTADKREKGAASKIVQDDTKLKESTLVDPGKLINPVLISSEDLHDEGDDVESKASEGSDDASLQPYDLSDDDTDLQKKFSELSDIAAALRKPDDPDGVSYRFLPIQPSYQSNTYTCLCFFLAHLNNVLACLVP